MLSFLDNKATKEMFSMIFRKILVIEVDIKKINSQQQLLNAKIDSLLLKGAIGAMESVGKDMIFDIWEDLPISSMQSLNTVEEKLGSNQAYRCEMVNINNFASRIENCNLSNFTTTELINYMVNKAQ